MKGGERRKVEATSGGTVRGFLLHGGRDMGKEKLGRARKKLVMQEQGKGRGKHTEKASLRKKKAQRMRNIVEEKKKQGR